MTFLRKLLSRARDEEWECKTTCLHSEARKIVYVPDACCTMLRLSRLNSLQRHGQMFSDDHLPVTKCIAPSHIEI